MKLANYTSARGFVQMVARHRHSRNDRPAPRSRAFKRFCYWDTKDYASL